MASSIKGITVEIGGDTTKLDKALTNVNRQSRDLQKELKAVNAALKLDPKNTELLAQKQTILKESIAATSEKLNVLKTAEEQVQQQFARGEVSEEQYRALQREVSNTEAKLKSLKDAAADSNLTLEKVADVTEKIGNKSVELGEKMMPVTAAIGGGAIAAGKLAMDFEDAMAKLSTIADTTEKPIGDLKKEITDLSDETGISATEIANNVYDAISAGQKTGDAVNFVSNATRLAKAGFTDNASSLDILTTSMNAYEMSADKVTRVSDLLIQTQNLGKTTVGQLASSMGKVIPTAKANNVQIDQLCAGYSILTAKGIATAESTTYMNSMLNELGKGGTTADKILREKTGKSFAELSKDGKSLGDVLQILKDHADESGVAFTDLWSSSEAGKAGLVLLGNGADDFNSRLAEMNDSTGATDAAFAKLGTNSNKIKITLNQLKNTATDLGTTLMTSAAPIIDRVQEKVKSFTQWFKSLDDSQKETIIRILAVVAAIAPALIAFGKLTIGVSNTMKAFKNISETVPKITGAFKAAGTAGKGLWAILSANPIAAVLVAVAALVAGLVLMYNKCEWFRDGVNKAFAQIKQSVQEMIQKVKPVLQQLGESFAALLDKLRPIFEFFTTYVLATIQGALAAVTPLISAVQNAIEFVSNIVSAFMALFQGDIDGFDKYLRAALQNVIDFAKNIISAICNYIVAFFQTFGVDVKQIFTDIWNGIVAIFTGVGQWFAERFQEAYTAITTIFAGIGQWFGARYTDIKNALATVAQWFQTMFQNAYTAVRNVFSGIGQWFAARYADIKNVFASVGSWFGEKFQEAYTAIQNVFSGIPTFLSGIWDKIKGIFTNVGTNIGEAIGGAFKSAMNNAFATAERAVNKAINFINGAIDIINDIPGVSVGHVGEVSLPRLAKGGILRNGQAIMAEAGPELIQMVNGAAVVTPLTASARNTAMETATGRGKGDFTQNLYITSPKALSPYETARQTRNATRNMILQIQGA